MKLNDFCEDLKRGRRGLDGINGVKILQDWKNDPQLNKWFLKIEINSEKSLIIQNKSIWYIVVDEDYPKGEVKIFPDACSDFTVTLEHQSNNGEIEKNKLWRKGSLCLESQLKCLGRYDSHLEPIDVDYRLSWNVKRAVNWINAANNNELIVTKDSFELPQFKRGDLEYFVFSEDMASFSEWQMVESNFGIAELDQYKSEPSVYFVKEFKTNYGNSINVNWGNYLSQSFGKLSTAIWVMLNDVPVINRWQAPNSFDELIVACKDQKIHLMNILKHLVPFIRDGKSHFLLLGFPIPKIVGDQNLIIHWQALKLPIISRGKYTARGFRNDEKGMWRRDKNQILTPDLKLNWLKCQNWNINEINSRGRLIEDITAMKILVIGVGTIGSAVAELLTRSGVNKIVIIDSDKLEIGNLSRHPLGLMQIGKSKSEEMAIYLNQVNPHVKVEYNNDDFEFSDEHDDEFDEFDLIIDCSGEDIILDELENFEFKKEKFFVSISIGFAAKRLYLFLQKDKRFNSDNFREKRSFWLEKEKSEFSEYDLPRDGTGCWSPVFPARYDDILIASSTALKVIEDFIKKNVNELISIYEQSSIDGIFVGYIKLE